MSSEAIKKQMKIIDFKDFFALDEANLNINNLNDDCLINIFQYLSFLERLKIESVCRRWHCLSQLSWSDVKTLKICREMKSKYIIHSDPEINTRFILTVIQRCKTFLNTLEVINDSELNYFSVTNKILECCKNLKTVNLHKQALPTTQICSKKDINLLIKNNANLSSIRLFGLKLDSQFLTYLNTDKIFEFRIIDCEIDSSNDYIFSKFKNLKIFEFSILDNCYNNVVNTFCKSKCENINEFIVLADKGECYDNLSKFLSKQKTLSKLCISYDDFESSLYYDKFLIESLNVDIINYLDLNVDEKTSCYLSRFKNLTTLHCKVQNLTNRIVLDVLECISLKKIGFFCDINGTISLTREGEDLFAKFREIESFTFSGFHENCDNIFKALAKCSKLIEVDLYKSRVPRTSLKSICSLPNLKILSLSLTLTSKLKLKNIIVPTALKLEKLNFEFCRQLTYETVEILNNIKIKRGDSHVLEISSSEAKLVERRLIKDTLDVNIGLVSLTIKLA